MRQNVSTPSAAPLCIAGAITLVLLLVRTVSLPLSDEWDEYLDIDYEASQRRAVSAMVVAAGVTPIIFIIVFVKAIEFLCLFDK